MARLSAGVIVHRCGPSGLEFLLVHPGGPFWARKDDGAWSIPKGEYGVDEDPATVAAREFHEEIGQPLPAGDLVALGEVRQSGGKVVTGFALAADLDVTEIVSNTFEMEWPPKSGRIGTFPEVDRAEWFPIADARRKINAAQSAFLDRVVSLGE